MAGLDGIDSYSVGPIEIYNPMEIADNAKLVRAVAESSEIATALPSVDFYDRPGSGNVLEILAAGIILKTEDPSLPAAVVYTGENNNHAAEILSAALEARLGIKLQTARVQILNTVIGKMSGIVTDANQIREQALKEVSPGLQKAYLVEKFNRIQISRINLPGFSRGIEVFEEKDDLLPFEEAKLYGHNAAHALLGSMLKINNAKFISEATCRPDIMELARDAFLHESGVALCHKYAGIDPLFTADGFSAYVHDLLSRMVNPNLRDSVDRVTRDMRRKLGWNDRIAGTMRLCIAQGITPWRYARGAAAAIRILAEEEGKDHKTELDSLWSDPGCDPDIASNMKDLIKLQDSNL